MSFHLLVRCKLTIIITTLVFMTIIMVDVSICQNKWDEKKTKKGNVLNQASNISLLDGRVKNIGDGSEERCTTSNVELTMDIIKRYTDKFAMCCVEIKPISVNNGDKVKFEIEAQEVEDKFDFKLENRDGTRQIRLYETALNPGVTSKEEIIDKERDLDSMESLTIYKLCIASNGVTNNKKIIIKKAILIKKLTNNLTYLG